MDKKLWLVGGGALIFGLLAGNCFGGSGFGHHYEKYGMHREDMARDMERSKESMPGMKHDMDSMMQSMSASLEGKTGKEFDAIFLREMIVHHEGAVDMAKAAQERAEDQRIKDLATAIITAQEKEIADMKSWQEIGQ